MTAFDRLRTIASSTIARLMRPEIQELISALSRTQEFLQSHREQHVSQRLGELQIRLAHDDFDAIVSTVSEATGGMGSLNDFAFGISPVDASLRTLVTEVEQSARQAARALGIALIR